MPSSNPVRRVHSLLISYFSLACVHLSFYRIKDGANKEMMGILVSYRVKVKLVVSLGGYVTYVGLREVLLNQSIKETGLAFPFFLLCSCGVA